MSELLIYLAVLCTIPEIATAFWVVFTYNDKIGSLIYSLGILMLSALLNFYCTTIADVSFLSFILVLAEIVEFFLIPVVFFIWLTTRLLKRN